MDDISTSVILEKNELMYLINCLSGKTQNANAEALSKYTGIGEPDSRKAIAGLIQKNILCFADNRLVTVKLFDYYVKKLLNAESAEFVEGAKKKIVFYNPGFVLLVKEHKLSCAHISIQAFKTKQELFETLKESGEQQ